METSPDAFEKKEPASKSADELIRLLLKLNAKIREKLSAARKKKSAMPQTDVVIIIMTNRQEKVRPETTLPGIKAPFLPGDWLEGFFAQIEGKTARRRKTS